MTRMDKIKAMTAREIAEKIMALQSLELDGFCKSDCEESKTAEIDVDEKKCIDCCICWLEETLPTSL